MRYNTESCPRCDSVMNVRKWYDEVGLVETDKKCINPDCQYHYSDSYGLVTESWEEDEEDGRWEE